mmetsp:Transcript_2354/g.4509  ORF Transcript_2354/g.4509 Transcript_2354/m.4509 type:complete len:82 (+) Transcript_2354:206-451(+)
MTGLNTAITNSAKVCKCGSSDSSPMKSTVTMKIRTAEMKSNLSLPPHINPLKHPATGPSPKLVRSNWTASAPLQLPHCEYE